VSSDLTEILDDDAPRTQEIREFRLHVVDGPDVGKTFRAARARTVVGTHAHADVRLRDRTLSRFHCELGLDAQRVVLRDLGSRNGTRVDGVPVLAAPLEDGARISLGRSALRFELRDATLALPLSTQASFGLMTGRSPAMRAAFALLERAAVGDTTVLLTGETGTGKELAARSLHRQGLRRERPFVVVDCGAIPATLLEAELFGHERGAFTGADRARPGAFEAAHGGTIFLDEIGELSIDLQPALLRVLEQREVRRLGGTRLHPVDVRVIAATNRDLRAEVNAHRFRPDLYYRLAVFEIGLPPLRERHDDLPELVDAILARLGATDHPAAPRLRARDQLAELTRHAWPGNVRELRNWVERALTLSGAAPPLAGAPAERLDGPYRQARDACLSRFERAYLRAALERAGGNVMAAARAARLGRAYFYRLLARHGLT
jgi:DNA-binding NtrC family response regulator